MRRAKQNERRYARNALVSLCRLLSQAHAHAAVHTLNPTSPVLSGRFEAGFQRVLQVDLKMESFPEPLGSRWMAWQVEYPASRSATQEVETEIRLAQEDLAGIVPLAMVSHCRVQRTETAARSTRLM